MKRATPLPFATDDRELFRDAVSDVRPLAPGAPPLARMPPSPRLRRGEPDSAAERWSHLPFDPTLPDVAEQLSYVRAGCAEKLLRQLRRGHYPVQENLDLHQLRVAAAQTSLIDFLACAQKCKWRCVRIVHGKGLRSGTSGPRLKKLTDRLLRDSADVLAFVSAPPALGGTGAVLVLLRAIQPSNSRTTTVA